MANLSFEQFMQQRQQQPFNNKRTPPSQGLAVEPQKPEEELATTGIGAGVGSLLATGAMALPSVPKNPVVAEAVIGGGAAIGDIGESIVTQAFEGKIPKVGKRELQSAKEAAGTSIVFGLGGRGVASGFHKSAKYFQSSVTPEARAAIDFLQSKRPGEQFMTGSEMTENRMLDIANNFAEHSVWGGGDIRKFKLHRDDVLKGIADDIGDLFGARKDNIHVGKMILNIRNHRNDISKKFIQDNMYKVVEAGTGHLKVSTKDLKQFMSPFAERNIATQGFGQELTGLGLAEDVMNFPKTMKVPDLMAFQRAIRAKVRSLKSAVETKNAPAIKFFGDVERKVDALVEQGLRQPGAPIDAIALKRSADNAWRLTKDRFSNDIINAFVKKVAKNPAEAVKHIVVAEHGGAEQLIVALKRTQTPESMKVIQRAAIEEIYKGATDPFTGVMKGTSLIKILEGKTGMGDRAIRELWGVEGGTQIKRFARSLAEVQKKAPVSEGSLAIQFTQMGAVLAVGAGSFKKEAMGILIGPKILAKAMVSPTINNLLLKGAAMSKKSPQWPALSARLIGLLGEAGLQKDRLKQRQQLDSLNPLSVTQQALSFTHPQGRPPGPAYTRTTPGDPPSLRKELQDMRDVFQQTR